MIRVLCCILLLFIGTSAFAGEYENALKKKDFVFLYLYSNNCGYCVKFNPTYEKLKKTYSNKIGFVKVDSRTPYGSFISLRFKASYVPFVIITDSKTKESYQVSPNCIVNYACLDSKLKNLTK